MGFGWCFLNVGLTSCFVCVAQGTVFYPLSTQGQGPDRYNPIEQIIVTAPLAGGNYTITVSFPFLFGFVVEHVTYARPSPFLLKTFE
jgi:hypothetical protein